MRLQLSTPSQIHFGDEILIESIPAIAAMGSRLLLVAGRQSEWADLLAEKLRNSGGEVRRLLIAGEPDLDTIRGGAELARSFQPEVILGLGGGSAMDAAKAISGLAANPGDPLDYLEVVGAGRTLSSPGPAVIAIPTTAGTGAEVTRNAVISVPERRVKVSMRSPYLMPLMAVVDPTLTYSMPPQVTASTGMDALVQLIEPFLSKRSNPFTDLFCVDGMARIGRSLSRAYQDGSDQDARREMSYASLLGGLALANAGLGAVHGFAGVIGGFYQASHGAICARLLAPVIKANYTVIEQQNLDAVLLQKFTRVAQLVTGSQGASVNDLVAWLEALCARLKIPRLGELGVQEVDFEPIARQSAVASSMKANPVGLEHAILLEILSEAW